ncbi:hypothetical protein ACIRFH_01310 [Streptomyces sp. NPDC093586]|uniref:hypothetical protein n=1 Tax=Streptomyces sp. NPDC093586 TaxID=3366042 RepID=UPI003821D657
MVVLPGRRRGFEARLERGALVLKTPASDRRIPLTAIERTETPGAGGRSFTVVLTAPRTIRPTSWTVHGRRAPAVEAFADALQRRLPVRDAAELRADGALLVTETPVAKPPADRHRTASRVAVALYLLAAAAMSAAGFLGSYGWFVALICWLFGSLAIPMRHFVCGGWEFTGDTWRLRTHGVLVEGRRLYAGAYEYTDLEGRGRRLTGTSEYAEQAEILYDPEGRTEAQVGRGTTGTLVFAVFVLIVSLAMTAALVALALAGPLGAWGVISFSLV